MLKYCFLGGYILVLRGLLLFIILLLKHNAGLMINMLYQISVIVPLQNNYPELFFFRYVNCI